MIIRRDPSHPAKEGEGFKKVIWEPKVDEHRPKCPEEELVATHAIESLEGPGHSHVVVVMKRRVEGNGYQRVRPDTVGWIHFGSCSARRIHHRTTDGGKG